MLPYHEFPVGKFCFHSLEKRLLEWVFYKEMFCRFYWGSHTCERTDVLICLSGDVTADVFLLQAYMDTLQTQWSWILQITKCIDVHLKENAAYFQVFMLSCNLIVV